MEALCERSWCAGCLRVEDLAFEAVGGLADEVNPSRKSWSHLPRVATDESLVFGAFRAFENLRIDGEGPQVWSSMSGFFQTRDGWVRFHGNYSHHQQAIAKALCVGEPAELRACLLDMESGQVEDRIVACGGVAAAVRSAGERQSHPHSDLCRMSLGLRLSIVTACSFQ